MNTQTMKNWPVARDKLRAKYPILSDADLQYEEGHEEELINRLFEDEHGFHASG